MIISRCITCLTPQTRPDTKFVDGRCSACISFDMRAKVNWAERKEQLYDVLRAGKNDSGFDCIVPSSGGKDSTFQVMTIKEMGFNPLVVTAATCHLTATGRRNIDNLAKHAATTVVYCGKSVRRRLNVAGIELIGDISYPEHVAINVVPFQVASSRGIPLIVYGEYPQREYGSPIDIDAAATMTRRWVSEFGGMLGLRIADLVGYRDLTADDLAPYVLPVESVEKTTAHWLGQFVPWDSWHNADVAKAAGMEWGVPGPANWWPHENLDNAQTGLHDYQMFKKYGFGRATTQLSVDVRNRRMLRDDALRCVEMLDGKFPEVYGGVSFEDMVSCLTETCPDVTPAYVLSCVDRFTDWELAA